VVLAVLPRRSRQVFGWYTRLLYLLNAIYLGSGIALLILYRSTLWDACDPEVFGFWWYDFTNGVRTAAPPRVRRVGKGGE
jgi:hypothetical protein